MSVCKMFVLNLMKKCWLASGRVLASSEKIHFVSVTWPYNVCLKESMQLLNFNCLSVFALLILVHSGSS